MWRRVVAIGLAAACLAGMGARVANQEAVGGTPPDRRETIDCRWLTDRAAVVRGRRRSACLTIEGIGPIGREAAGATRRNRPWFDVSRKA